MQPANFNYHRASSIDEAESLCKDVKIKKIDFVEVKKNSLQATELLLEVKATCSIIAALATLTCSFVPLIVIARVEPFLKYISLFPSTESIYRLELDSLIPEPPPT